MGRGFRSLGRTQAAALAVFIVWAALLALGLFGQALAIPSAVTVPAGVIAIAAMAFLIPGSALFALLRYQPAGRSTPRPIWIAWRWRFAIAGTWMALIAVALLLPSTQVTSAYRIGGAVGLIWAFLSLWVAALGFRAKAQSDNSGAGRGVVLRWNFTLVAFVAFAVSIAVGIGAYVVYTVGHR